MNIERENIMLHINIYMTKNAYVDILLHLIILDYKYI